MSNELTIQDRVYSLEADFTASNPFKMNFAKEAQFALQLLSQSDSLMKAAQANPLAFEYAILNLASIGISLNPALKEAYLIPRKGKACLDISYVGLSNLAIKGGGVLWVQAQIVRAKDEFVFNGVGTAPTHTMNPFENRGEMIGVYCVAKTSTGESLSTIMSIAECFEIRDKSSQAASGPWKDWPEEMIKKTVIKRASKLWPRSERLAAAVSVIDLHEGIDFNSPKAPHVDTPSNTETPNDKTFANIRALLAAKNKTETALLGYLSSQFNCELEKLEDLNPAQVEYSYRMLGSK